MSNQPKQPPLSLREVFSGFGEQLDAWSTQATASLALKALMRDTDGGDIEAHERLAKLTVDQLDQVQTAAASLTQQARELIDELEAERREPCP